MSKPSCPRTASNSRATLPAYHVVLGWALLLGGGIPVMMYMMYAPDDLSWRDAFDFFQCFLPAFAVMLVGAVLVWSPFASRSTRE